MRKLHKLIPCGLVFLIASHVSLLAVQETPAMNVFSIQTLPPVSSRGHATNNEIIPADVLARSLLVRDENNLIRREIGKPINQQRDIGVTNAAPREVYFQAQTLLKKANRLAFEFTASLVEQPKAAEVQEIKPAHVWRTLDEALKRVLVVRRLPRH